MRKTAVMGILFGALAGGLPAEPAVLVNAAGGRPVLSLALPGGTVTAALAPGTRWAVEASRLSGAGEKNLALEPGQTYYLARFGALPRWYRLADTQVLAVNQAGRALRITLPDGSAGVQADGALVLADSTLEIPLELVWTDPEGVEGRATPGPGLYRFVAENGAVVLRPWAEDSAKE